uniref:Peptide chain release factor domain-containing protein n=1 Tax=Colobus angolensis palliatus TaxID=336983 RepID=A0A2K5I7K2_COLAP
PPPLLGWEGATWAVDPARRAPELRPGRALQTFLKHQAGSEAHLKVRRHELLAVVKLLNEKEQELQETEHLLHKEDEDLRKLAENEITLFEASEETDENDLILEVTAGVGGQEAMLFTSEMFDIYQPYAAFQRWHFETLEYFPSEIGGLRRTSASIGGSEAYRHMKFEGHVRRVQRVPKTEKQGLIHTTVLPQPTEINLVINPKDLRIDTKRASGAGGGGGQHVNTTDGAVQLVHLPTGRRKGMRRKRSVSEYQQKGSQLKNKELTMKKLRVKQYNMYLEEEMNKHSARKIQIGSKGRSEKIRTYNFPQNQVSDYRISKSLHDLETFMQGDYLLDEFGH